MNSAKIERKDLKIASNTWAPSFFLRHRVPTCGQEAAKRVRFCG